MGEQENIIERNQYIVCLSASTIKKSVYIWPLIVKKKLSGKTASKMSFRLTPQHTPWHFEHSCGTNRFIYQTPEWIVTPFSTCYSQKVAMVDASSRSGLQQFVKLRFPGWISTEIRRIITVHDVLVDFSRDRRWTAVMHSLCLSLTDLQ